MEDDLNYFENYRQPFFNNRRLKNYPKIMQPETLQFKQPTRLIFGMQPYSNPTRRNMGDNLNIFENGRRPQFFEYGR